jgi:signal transduction histidine kinase
MREILKISFDRSSGSRLMLLVLTVALVASAALCVLAWRLAVLDRAAVQQRHRERLEYVADSASGMLLQRINDAGVRLRSALQSNDQGRIDQLRSVAGGCESCMTMLLAPALTLFPERRLRYVPDAGTTMLVDDSVFNTGEALEFKYHNNMEAGGWFLDLANRSKGTLRAAALLRAARNFTKAASVRMALDCWADLETMGRVPVDGEPSDLVARFARLPLLGESTAGEQARSLLHDLETGLWPLSRASYEYHSDALSKLTGQNRQPPIWEESVEAVASARSRGTTSGERVIWVNDSKPVLIVWRSNENTFAAVAFTPAHIRGWLAELWGFDFGLETADRRTILPAPNTGPNTRRVLSFANDYWRLTAAALELPAGEANRHILLIAGLALVVVVVVAGSYSVLRAVSREVAVSRLQADFVSAVSHEFRTPLTTLRSMSEMLERGRVSTEERKQRYYAQMARETARLHRLVEDLLNFGQVQAGKKHYMMRPTEVAAVVSEVVAEIREETAALGFDIRLGQLTRAIVLADVDALKLAIRNLLDNAVKYSDNSRTVDVDVCVENGSLCISVQDYGMGIPDADLNRIFGKFERGSAARASSVRGTGLGLAMVHSILQAHGGSVRVKSREHGGSIFTLTLPHSNRREEALIWRES